MTRNSTIVGGKGSAIETYPGSRVWRLRALVGYAKLPDGTDNTSKPIQKRSTAYGTKRDAETALSALVARADAGTVSTGSDTVDDYFTRWLEVASTGWASSTERRNRYQVTQVTELLGPTKRLSSVGPGDLAKVFADLSHSGSSPANTRRAYAVIHAALNDAVEDGVLAVNPATKIGKRLPTVTRQDPRPATADEVHSLIDEVETATTPNGKRVRWGPMWADLFTLYASTALRDGEAVALRWQDVDVTSRTLRVVHSVETVSKAHTGSSWALKDPKGHQVREIGPLPATALAALERRWSSASSQAPDAFVFSEDPAGLVPVHPNRVTKVFADAADAAGLPDHVALKTLRSFAITVIAKVVGLPEAARWAGHKEQTTTARHYTGRTSGDAELASAALDAALAPTAALTAGAKVSA